MDELRKIGSFFAQNAPKVGGALTSNLGTIIPGALTTAGFINNWLQQRRYNQMQDIARDPAKARRYFQGLEQPLAAGAVAGAENEAQAVLGERGLSQSPAQSAAVYSQALAPLYQAQQDAAMQAGGNLLGSALSVPPNQSDVSGPLAQLMQRLQKQPVTGQGQTGGTSVGGGTYDPVTGTYTGGWSGPTGGYDPVTGTYPGDIPIPDVSNLPAASIPDWNSIIGGFSSAPAFGVQ